MSGTQVHPTACVEMGAQLGTDVRIGPFCQIGADVVLGDRSEVMAHCVITGVTIIGENTRIYPHAILGAEPQNNKHKGGRTTLEVGRNCIIREGVTMHRGSDTSLGRTVIGDGCMFMVYAHVAHDCVVGNNVTFANNVMIGGHVVVSDHVIMGGAAAVQQHVRIGHHAFVGGLASLTTDLIPYATAVGNNARLGGLNIIGMKRSGLERGEIHALRHAVVMLFDRIRPVKLRAADVLARFSQSKAVADVIAFVLEKPQRPLCVPNADFAGETGARGCETG